MVAVIPPPFTLHIPDKKYPFDTINPQLVNYS